MSEARSHGPGPDDALREQGKTWRAARAGCPHPELLFARRSEAVETSLHDALARHLAACAACAALARDIDAVEHDVSDAAIEGRVLSRATAHSSRWPVVATVAAVVGAVLLGGAWWWQAHRAREATATAEQAAAALWPIEPAPVRSLSPAVAPQAGNAGGDDASALLAALEPYRAGRFADASARLEPYVRAHPAGPLGLLYSGVALLMERRPEAARPLLERAAAVTPRDGADEIQWYRAAAEQRSGLRDAARVRLRGLCAHIGPYQSRACAAQGTLP